MKQSGASTPTARKGVNKGITRILTNNPQKPPLHLHEVRVRETVKTDITKSSIMPWMVSRERVGTRTTRVGQS